MHQVKIVHHHKSLKELSHEADHITFIRHHFLVQQRLQVSTGGAARERQGLDRQGVHEGLTGQQGVTGKGVRKERREKGERGVMMVRETGKPG